MTPRRATSVATCLGVLGTEMIQDLGWKRDQIHDYHPPLSGLLKPPCIPKNRLILLLLVKSHAISDLSITVPDIASYTSQWVGQLWLLVELRRSQLGRLGHIDSRSRMKERPNSRLSPSLSLLCWELLVSPWCDYYQTSKHHCKWTGIPILLSSRSETYNSRIAPFNLVQPDTIVKEWLWLTPHTGSRKHESSFSFCPVV